MDRTKTTIITIIAIVAAVAIFIAVGAWLFYPKNVPAATSSQAMPVQYVQGMGSSAELNPAASGTSLGSANPAAEASPPPQSPSINVNNQQVLVVDGAGNPLSNDYQTSQDGSLIRNPGNAPTTSPAPASSAAASSSPVAPSPGAMINNGLVISAGTQGKAEAVIQLPVKPAKQAKEAAEPRAVKAPAASAKPQPKAAVKAPVVKSTPAVSAKSSPATKKSGKEFWIQVVSTTSKDRVEQVRKDLAALGINGRVMAFNKDGTDFYRLRYGPYGDREEAAKFLEWVKIIKGLDGSFITEEKEGTAQKPTAAAKPSPSVTPAPAKP
jgi:cell division septation protein DedD